MRTGQVDSLAFARDELVRLVEIPSFSDEEHALVDAIGLCVDEEASSGRVISGRVPA